MSTDADNGQKGFGALARYLRDHSWKAERMQDETAFKARKEGDLCPLLYYFQVKTELQQFLFYIVPEIDLFQDMVPPVGEFVCRANHGMRIGSFELDWRSGRLSFKSSLNFKGVELSPILIDNTIQPALTAFDEFFPGAARVIAGLDTPADAIRKIEYGE
ncbi:MAG TPA: YbjN domain-containing protein [Thermoanaerobaculia bacterium]|nr:YbjN domain-containing protein [Thermoanaerobaculia bacterium]